MRSVGGIAARVLAWDNLRLATWKALKGCRRSREAVAFVGNLETRLTGLREQLASGRLDVGQFSRFTVFDPKQRDIFAPAFHERVLHHAIMNACEPVLDRRLIHDCCACRKGLGQRRAIQRAEVFAGRHAFFLKLDIRRYFDSIDHGIVLTQLARLFRERQVIGWFEQILGTYRTQTGRGLPIGSLISQHVANSYLAPLDRLVKEDLRIPGYVRYMDDVALWCDSRARLKDALSAVGDFVHQELLLELKPTPYLNRSGHGMEFLGLRVFPGHTRLSHRSKRRFRREYARQLDRWTTGVCQDAELQRCLQALVAFTLQAKAWRFRRGVLHPTSFGEWS